MRWRAIIVVLVLMAVVGAVIVGFFWIGDKTQFRPQVRSVLTQLNEGEAEEVWRESSYFFQRSINQDAFQDMVSRLGETLGKFERISEIIEVHRGKSLGGKIGEVVAELEFENGITQGTFGFHRGKDKTWRLVGMSVTIPPDLEAKADKLEREFERIRAPDEVVGKVSEILTEIRSGGADEVWRQAAKPFKESINVTRFGELAKKNEEELGKFVRVLTVSSSGLHPAKDHAKVSVLVEFEKVRTNGQFRFRKGDDDAWRLSFFKLLIPEPVISGRVPQTNPAAPAGIPTTPGAVSDAGPP